MPTAGAHICSGPTTIKTQTTKRQPICGAAAHIISRNYWRIRDEAQTRKVQQRNLIDVRLDPDPKVDGPIARVGESEVAAAVKITLIVRITPRTEWKEQRLRAELAARGR